MDNTEFVNAYINKLVTEVGEAAKARVLLSTQLEFTGKQLEQLVAICEELRKENEELKAKLAESDVTGPEIDYPADRFVTSEVKYNKKKKKDEDF